MTDILNGPWRVGANMRGELTIESKDSRFYLADVLNRPNQYAVATLMAAAPQMLAALECIRDSGVYTGAIADSMMREAIKKATEGIE